MEYAKTKDILDVMQLLGHRNIKNTLVYTQLSKFESNKYRFVTVVPLTKLESLYNQGSSMFATITMLCFSENANNR
jgi:hypothetical protein